MGQTGKKKLKTLTSAPAANPPPIQKAANEEPESVEIDLRDLDPVRVVDPWWKTLGMTPTRSDNDSGVDWHVLRNGAQQAALLRGYPVYEDSLYGPYCKTLREPAIRWQRENGFRTVIRTLRTVYGFRLLAVRDSDGSMIEINASSYARIQSPDPQLIQDFLRFWRPLIPVHNPVGSVHVMVATTSGIQFKSIANCGQDFEPGNYNREAAEGYQRILEGIQSPNPPGRISILDGPPGCGKTYMIMGLLQAVNTAKFVIVPAANITSMADPNFLPALLEFGASSPESRTPIVFIIEDADECLARRDSGNQSAVSTLLNFGDGILGRALDVRIVATTNQQIQDLDPALVREGRLQINLHVGPLRYKDGVPQTVLERLLGRPLETRQGGSEWEDLMSGDRLYRDLTLAQVYSLFRDHDWTRFNPKKEEKKVGFS